jgi:5'-nucleotidase
VDLIVAGHTHAGVAHRVAGIPIIESYSMGRAFGRVDFELERGSGRVADVTIFPPEEVCPGEGETPCANVHYMGRPVVPHPEVVAAIRPGLEGAAEAKARSVGVELGTELPRDYDRESPLGNLLADLMLEARPKAEVALMNAGGIRSELPAGELTYGQFYQTFPFDNRFAVMKIEARKLAAILEANLRSDGGMLSVSGVRLRARCEGGTLEVELRDERGRPIDGDRPLRVLISDYLATAEGHPIAEAFDDAEEAHIEDGLPIRDVLVETLRKRGGTLRADDPKLFTPERPRITYPGERPVTCG